MKKSTIIMAIMVFWLSSCNESTLINQFYELPVNGWQYKNIMQDSFQVVKPNHYHLISANLRIDEDYMYSNIHLKLKLTDPDGETKTHHIPLTLAEKSGKWLGSGLGSALTYQLPILHRKTLTKKGTYHVSIAQDMRLENLTSVLAVGIKVEEQEEIY